MAARNVKSIPGFEAADKMQSSTLKRQPSPDWSKNDLLRLLSYFEGELQARDITIAALKAEKAKQLLYQAKYGRFGLGDPFVALQRDTIGTRDSNFDEAAVKSMYDNQLAQLENLIATQRKAQLKMREQLANAEKRYHKVCSDLEDEKRKHAQDTAQGDDVTYMLEKERERLRQEIDFEKSNSKKLEKDLRRTLAALEEERASAAKHKQVALLLLKERKHVLQKMAAQQKNLPQGSEGFSEDDLRSEDFAGLEGEATPSLAMEAALEEQLGEFEAERAALRAGLDHEQTRTRELESQVEALQRQVQSMAARTSLDSIEIRSGVSAPHLQATPPFPTNLNQLTSPPSASPGSHVPLSSQGAVRSGPGLSGPLGPGRLAASAAIPVVRQGPKAGKVLEGGRVGSSSPEREVIYRPVDSGVRKVQYGGSGGGGVGGYQPPGVDRQTGGPVSPAGARGEAKVVTMGSSGPDSGPLIVGGGVGSGGNSATVVTQGNSKVSFHVSPGSGGINVGGGGGVGSPRRTAPAMVSTMSVGRGTPPPIPPNKPNIAAATGGKPVAPAKVGVMGRDRGAVDSKVVQIPVNIVSSPASSAASSPGSSNQSSRETSPIRKTAQPPPSVDVPSPACPNASPAQTPPASALDFLGPEMDSLQHMLASLSTGEAGSRDSPGIDSSPVPSPSPPAPPAPPAPVSAPPTTPITLSTIDIQNSAVHNMVAGGDLAALRMLILDHEADVNLPLKDGTTPIHCAVATDRQACLRLLLEKGGNANAQRDDRVTPIHIAAAYGHDVCLQILLEHGATVTTVTQQGNTPLHLAADHGCPKCCRNLLRSGADALLPNTAGLSAVHYAILRQRVDVLSCLLEGQPRPPTLDTQQSTALLRFAAHLHSQECLRLLLEVLPVKLNSELDHSAAGVNSSSATLPTEPDPEEALSLVVELKTQLEGATVSCTRIGSVDLDSTTSWPDLELRLRSTVSHFLRQLDRGLRTRRLARLEAESSGEGDAFTLGISMSRVDMYELGFYRWSPGMQTEKLPHSMAANNVEKKVVIIIDGTDNLCELIAFDILHPVPVIHDYLCLLRQYRNVVFYGPVNSGKSYLVQRLAQCLASEEKALGEKPAIFQFKLSSKTTHQDLLSFLIQKGCLLSADKGSALTPILILDNVEKVNFATLLGPLLEQLNHRGQNNAFSLQESVKNSGARFYFPDKLCILATLNHTRCTGIEMQVQQRFHWVQFRHDLEPLRRLLARHYLRRLYHLGNGQVPPLDDPVVRATEWMICVWHRLNDSLGKLGLPDIVLGPCCFFKCPVEKRNPQLILQWVRDLWNSVVSPQVSEAVRRGGASEPTPNGQHKVASTALYVLMQRAIVLSCPLPAAEKEAYLQGFNGSNDLDLPFRSDRRDQRGSGIMSQLTGRGGRASSQGSGSDTERSGVSPRSPLHKAGHSPSSSSSTRSKSRHREERGRPLEVFMGSNIKRRSLSESSVNKTAQRLDELERAAEGVPGDLGVTGDSTDGVDGAEGSRSRHAKVPKLEVRAARILSLSNSFRPPASPSQPGGGKSSPSTPLQSPTGQISHRHRKSRSSENISPSGLYASGKQGTADSPFSFSLSTPKSSLTVFRFLDKSPPQTSSAAAESPPLVMFSSPPSSSSSSFSSSSTQSSSSTSLSSSPLTLVTHQDQSLSSEPNSNPSFESRQRDSTQPPVQSLNALTPNGGRKVPESLPSNGDVVSGRTASLSQS